MKKYILLLVVIFILAIIAVYYLASTQEDNDSDRNTLTIAGQVAEQLAEKYDRPTDTVQVEVETDDGQFAKGLVRFTDESGGGIWFAAKTEQGWQVVYDGNGIIPCLNANIYNLPADLAPQCIDTENGNQLVQRQAVIGGQADAYGCLIAAGYSWNEGRQQCVRSWEVATMTEAENAVRRQLAEKYNKSIEEVSTKVTKIDGNYVAGSVSFSTEVGAPGGLFLAMKNGDGWEIVYDGNGSVDCEKLREDYNFSELVLVPQFCD